MPPEQATRNVHAILEQLDPPRLPRVGAAAADSEQPANNRHLFGSDGLGNNNFGIVGQSPALALTKTFTSGSSEIPTTSWVYRPPYTTSNLTASTIDPLFGQANNGIFRTVIDKDALMRL